MKQKMIDVIGIEAYNETVEKMAAEGWLPLWSHVIYLKPQSGNPFESVPEMDRKNIKPIIRRSSDVEVHFTQAFYQKVE